ncbi:MAG: substrate-binding domain-containing protein [Bacillota bacterium]|nr:substrate-binding domain-containing protein [Bacillota bacterium]
MKGTGDGGVPPYRVVLILGDQIRGDRLFALLEAVALRGSLNQARADVGLSYRYAWGLVKQAEERLGVRLLDRRTGGARGGGAQLTAAARDLLDRYRRFQAGVERRIPVLAGPEEPPAADRAPGAGTGEAHGSLVLAATVEPVETGLVPALAEAFLAETGIAVRPLAAGSGQALDLAREGRADLVLSHAPEAEEEFVTAGFGTGRHPLMEDDFVVVGPEGDPAGVRQAGTVHQAFQAIARARAPFLSRGDRSGTHLRERGLWEAAGVQPEAPWYRVDPLGVLGSMHILTAAAAKRAYTLVDRATLRAARPEGLAILWEGGPELRDVFSLVPVSAERAPWVRRRWAEAFARWAVGPAGQGLIARFGLDPHGRPLFRPLRP